MQMTILYNVLDEVFDKLGMPVKKLSGYVKSLSDLYNSDVSAVRNYMSKTDYQLAYLFYFYPINVYKYLTLVHFYRDIFGGVGSFYDYGCGPLTFFTALSLTETKPGKLYATDMNRSIILHGENILKQIAPEMQNIIKLSPPDYPVECISFGNVLTEMDTENRTKILRKSAERLSKKNNLLLILEPGTRAAFSNLTELKDSLSYIGFKSLAPCPSTACPMAENDWCHENVKFPRSKLIETIENQTGLDNRYINFSYLLMSSTLNPTQWFNENTYRVVSNLLVRKGHYSVYLCGTTGINVFDLQNRDISPDNQAFTSAARGDIIEIQNYAQKGILKRIGRTSRVIIIKKFNSLK